MTIPAPILEILDLARWAPSGDNTQPWRFEVVNEHHVIVHCHDTRDHCVYDLDGHPSQIAAGALLENISIAASEKGLLARIIRREGQPEIRPIFDVHFAPDAVKPDSLIPFIQKRAVQRRAMSSRPLTAQQKQVLQLAVGPEYSILWFEGFQSKGRIASLMFSNAKLRLTLPEAYSVHRNIIEWRARFSEDRVPDQALGLDAGTTRLMHWVMGDWKRVEFFNRYLAGTLLPRIELDLIPGMACAAHFAILARQPAYSSDDYIAAGRAMQRFWLTATSLGLWLQPEMTPLIFSRYIRESRTFTTQQQKIRMAQTLAEQAERIFEGKLPHAVFMARIGLGPEPVARSIRKPLESLLIEH